MEKNLIPNTYSNWQPYIDGITFLSLTREKSIPSLLIAGGHALSFSIAKKFSSTVAKVCVLAASLELTTFVLSSTFSYSTELSGKILLTNLLIKSITYALFKSVLYLHDAYTLTLPQEIYELDNIGDNQLKQVHSHLANFPFRTQTLPLFLQIALQKKFHQSHLFPLPIKDFSNIGTEWRKQDVKFLSEQDIYSLPTEKKSQVYELLKKYSISIDKTSSISKEKIFTDHLNRIQRLGENYIKQSIPYQKFLSKESQLFFERIFREINWTLFLGSAPTTLKAIFSSKNSDPIEDIPNPTINEKEIIPANINSYFTNSFLFSVSAVAIVSFLSIVYFGNKWRKNRQFSSPSLAIVLYNPINFRLEAFQWMLGKISNLKLLIKLPHTIFKNSIGNFEDYILEMNNRQIIPWKSQKKFLNSFKPIERKKTSSVCSDKNKQASLPENNSFRATTTQIIPSNQEEFPKKPISNPNETENKNKKTLFDSFEMIENDTSPKNSLIESFEIIRDLSQQKSLSDSFEKIEPNSSLKNSLLDFDLLEESRNAWQTWEKAFNRLMDTNEYLSNDTILAYVSYLKEKGPSFILIPELLLPTWFYKKTPILIQEHIKKALTKTENELVFIPFILENPLFRIPYLGRFFSDHIVTLCIDRKNKKIEYYDSQGQAIKNESRKISGSTLKPSELVELMKFVGFEIESNKYKHQKDYFNCGTFICSFMEQRLTKSFNKICEKKNIDILQTRIQLAENLKRHYAPPQLTDAKNMKDIISKLKHEKLTTKIIYKNDAKLIAENAACYFSSEAGEINQTALYDQIKKDLSRGNNGMSQFLIKEGKHNSQITTPEAIFTILQKKYNDKSWVLKMMTLLQQGVFASIQLKMMQELGILGTGYFLSGQGDYIVEQAKKNKTSIRQYFIDTEENCITCSAQYQLGYSDEENKDLYREIPYAILKAEIKVPLCRGQATESWWVEEVLNKDSNGKDEELL